MKKLYSLVLMATALLIGTNVWAKDHVAQIVGGVSYETLEAAFAAAQAAQGDQTIVMLANDTLTKPIDFGKATSQAEYTAAHKVVTLDFKGKTVTMEGTTKKVNNVNVKQDRMFNVYSGALKLVNSTPAAGGGLHHTYNSGKYYTILVFGSIRKDCDPSEDKEDKLGYYTYLSIGEGVNIVSDGENGANGGICVMIMPNGTNKVTQTNKFEITASTAPQTEGGAANLANSNIWNGYTTCGSYIYTNDYKYNSEAAYNKQYTFSDPRGVANGVRIDVYGHLEGSLYAMQSNGQLAGPDDKYKEAGSYYNTYKNTFYDNKIENGEVADISDDDKDNAPYIHIYTDAVLTNKASVGDDLKKKQVALYTSGYARWYVEGKCSGTTGLYMKSGDVTLNNATISSSFTGTASNNSGQTIGVSGQGNAVVVESNDHYSGHLSLTVEGDTKVETPAESGTALLETIATGSDPNVEHININGGTLTGENAIVISDATAGEKVVTIAGSNLDGAVDPSTLTEIISNGSHATTVGNTTVISTGAAPTADNTGSWNTIKDKEGQNVKWNVAEPASIESGTITFGELQIIPASAGHTLTIANGAALVVDRLIMDNYARIIVQAGGKLIVNGTQGINAPVVDNIVLESSEASQALFLFNPAVSSNKTPNATVHMTVAKGVDGGEDVWTRFAIPVLKMPASGWIKKNSAETWLYGWDYENQTWATVTDGTITGNRAMKPWTGYSMSNNLETEEVYTFKNELVGNVNAGLNFVHEGYNFFGNSYSSYIDAKTILQGLTDNHVDGAIYMWNVNNQAYTSTSLYALGKSDIEAWQKDVAPMQTFILQLRGANEASQSINYGDAVWNNARYGHNASTNQAPRRQMVESNDDAYINMVVTAANGKSDRILFFENAANSDAYERGYDAAKYMNENTINFYATINGENYGNVVTDNLEGKEISLQTVDDVTYTITFKTVEGNEYALLDKETNRVTAIVAGNTYEFAAQPNSTIEGRFEIVGRHNMPTAIDNTEVKANVKGIYTLTGQFVGEDFNVLPAGVYVVNGVKIVK